MDASPVAELLAEAEAGYLVMADLVNEQKVVIAALAREVSSLRRQVSSLRRQVSSLRRQVSVAQRLEMRLRAILQSGDFYQEAS